MYVEIPRLFFFFIFRTRRKILLANTSFPVFKYLESFPLPSQLVLILAILSYHIIVILHLIVIVKRK